LLLLPKKDTIIQMTAEMLQGLLAGNPVAADAAAMDYLRRQQQTFRRDIPWGFIARHHPVTGVSQVIPVQPRKAIQRILRRLSGGEA
jgi:hypothetical protein